MADQFEVGDVVLVKSGGQKMTVDERFLDGRYRCVWHGEKGFEEKTFSAGVLMKEPPARPLLSNVIRPVYRSGL